MGFRIVRQSITVRFKKIADSNRDRKRFWHVRCPQAIAPIWCISKLGHRTTSCFRTVLQIVDILLDFLSMRPTIEISPPIELRIEWADSQGSVTASWLPAHLNCEDNCLKLQSAWLGISQYECWGSLCVPSCPLWLEPFEDAAGTRSAADIVTIHNRNQPAVSFPVASFYVENFGCRAAQADGGAASNNSSANSDWHALSLRIKLNPVVLNTCTVTASAEQDARSTIRRVHREILIARSS